MKFKELFKQIHRLQHSWLHTLPAKVPEKNVASTKLHIPEPEYNTDFLCDPANRDTILNNIKRRKSIGDINRVLELSDKPEKRELLSKELSRIPNCTHSAIFEYGDTPKFLKEYGEKPEYDFEPQEFTELANHLRLIRTGLGPVAGQKAYMLLGDLARLEEALVRYTVKKLLKNGFQLLSVPDIVPTELINRCGLIMEGARTLVYNLDPYYGDDYSLSGTAEIALAGRMMNTILSRDELPLKLVAVSRCYRAETSTKLDERGIYRVHQFTKVEMFVCCEPLQSEEVFHDLRNMQEELFSSLGLHFRVMDMPPTDLGTSAYRKSDIEGWMPGRKMYGELSSCSNCTDYQSRRLNIKYKTEDGGTAHVHTLNGTACAIPRMLIALCESYQTKHARITVPKSLVPLMKDKTLIRKQPVATMRTFKYKQDLSESDI
ncbi:serine--tRNA ligase, mitochondrial isoform X2 [Harpegnathos saltator]|uniref:serine--tRNA ligase n=2 Tax=Harpegnathos saltator TaxID=610380 RepID=E2B6X9_HARSA|nr:serine--tRNA ligase, mitochondrial isoform X2 [Harpegnathos saltator]XP_011153670.1 serine--tRNA ligase, mitochondrial isoform X2 [Harpegnathos saltator]XP_019700906.1 serine--tRNA ligase, mitochondrial isoform X2 [Harpegnathos saltator]XP_025157714.1 serine--tRNA ligase, mitochondrial isoform X2 [Harpegnathos saltator]XP_025157715.1 serine--tRNA ligase, mitochondrial isoform X2 [Harpegnathos saltator]EFN88554.1 Seryl-tRNA synthetase, mitochondrial [Harpegnathos saltator]